LIVLIDNFDSFSYNLYQLIGSVNPDIQVIRNNQLTAEEIQSLVPSHIVISPGPGRPKDAGICEDVIANIYDVPILGVCLGHQAICETFGAKITYAKTLMHGKLSIITLRSHDAIFNGLPETFSAARYHSLAVDESTIPNCLSVTAVADDGEIMAVEHKERKIYGVQFHPESILTPNGKKILKNFLLINQGNSTK
jgi:anthranilate synthase component 2